MTKNVIYLISFLICSIVTQAQTTAWDGTIATKLVNTGSGTGAEDSPIEIASASELAYLAQQTNAGGKELILENGGAIDGKTNFQGIKGVENAGALAGYITNSKITKCGVTGGNIY